MAEGIITERLFRKNAKAIGLDVQEGKPIRSPEPVANKLGDNLKKVTVPDFYLVDRNTGLEMHVEITSGKGGGSHKQAQRRVVAAAGVENYVQIAGEDVLKIDAEPIVGRKKSILFALLGWKLE